MNIIDAVKLMPAQPETENLAYELGRHDQRFIPATPAMGALHPLLKGFTFLDGARLINSETGMEVPMDVDLLDDRWTLAPLEDLERIASKQEDKSRVYAIKALIWFAFTVSCLALFLYLNNGSKP